MSPRVVARGLCTRLRLLCSILAAMDAYTGTMHGLCLCLIHIAWVVARGLCTRLRLLCLILAAMGGYMGTIHGAHSHLSSACRRCRVKVDNIILFYVFFLKYLTLVDKEWAGLPPLSQLHPRELRGVRRHRVSA